MDAELKAKWVAALRSGEFGQTQGMLHDERGGGFCCLGVLCKVMGAEFSQGTVEGTYEDDDGYLMPEYRTFNHVPVLNGRVLSNNDDEELNSSFCKEVGIPDQSVLIGLNDGYGKEGEPDYRPGQSFAEIADFIEKNL